MGELLSGVLRVNWKTSKESGVSVDDALMPKKLPGGRPIYASVSSASFVRGCVEPTLPVWKQTFPSTITSNVECVCLILR